MVGSLPLTPHGAAAMGLVNTRSPSKLAFAQRFRMSLGTNLLIRPISDALRRHEGVVRRRGRS